MSNQIPQIQIATQINSQQMVVIKIADNGIGIPELVKQRLFEPLFTTKHIGKGTGLGLSIAHQIVVKKHDRNSNFLTRSHSYALKSLDNSTIPL